MDHGRRACVSSLRRGAPAVGAPLCRFRARILAGCGCGVSRGVALIAVACALLAVGAGRAAAQSSAGRYAALADAELHSPFAKVADAVMPAVVAIRTRKTATHGEMLQENPLEEMFRQFFPRDREFMEREFDLPGAGSGFLVSADGYVLTNNHVVADVDEIEVKLPGNEEYFKARVVGQDPSTDVAVVKIESGKGLPFLKFGDSEKMEVGDWAIAIGNPLGRLEGSLTVGVLSAKGRFDLPIQGAAPRYQDFLQTDAAINPGNSGGPLLNIRGEVVGVNTAINASAQGIGFAIPINLASRVYRDLVQHGHVVRGYLGVVMTNLTPELARTYKIDRAHGVLVQEVAPDTPAATAGLKEGDLILQFNGIPVGSSRDLQFRVADADVGSKAALKILREAKERQIDVTLIEYPEEQLAAAAANLPVPAAERWLGMAVHGLNDPHSPRVQELKERFDIKQSTGALVTDVGPGSPADAARLRPGDVIVEIGDMEIAGIDEYLAAVDRLRDAHDPVTLMIRRGDLTSYVTVDPGQGRKDESAH
jgi:serine protease Do